MSSYYTNAALTAGYASTLLSGSSDTSLSSLLSLIQQRKSSLVKGSDGKYSLPTIDTLNKTTDLTSKVRILGQLATNIKTYTTAATSTGITTRVSEMTQQMQQVMDGIQSTVSSLASSSTTTASSSSKTTGSALKLSQTSLSSTLSTMRSAMVAMAKLMEKMPSSEAQTVKQSLVAMDTQAKSIASAADLSWSAVFVAKGSSASTGTTGSASSSSGSSTTSAASITTRLLDYLA